MSISIKGEENGEQTTKNRKRGERVSTLNTDLKGEEEGTGIFRKLIELKESLFVECDCCVLRLE